LPETPVKRKYARADCIAMRANYRARNIRQHSLSQADDWLAF
jgi:hypothetical protein